MRASKKERLEDAIDGVEERRSVINKELHSNSKSMIDNVNNVRMDPRLQKRRKLDTTDMKECCELDNLQLVKVQGIWNVVDPFTKQRSRTTKTTKELIKVLRDGWYDPPIG